MQVLITGGTGFLGRFVASACVEAGHGVRTLVRDEKARAIPGTERVIGRLEDKESLRTALSKVDAVLHLAGKVSRDPSEAASMHAIHVEGTLNLLDAMQAANVRRMILASTSGTIAVSATARRDATEQDEAPLEIVGRWPYYISKRLQEQEVLRRDKSDRIEAIVLNPSLLLGPGDDRLSSTTDVLNVLNGRIPAVTSGTAAIVDVRDVAPAFVAALERGRRGQRYLLNGANMSIRSFFNRIAQAGDVSPPRLEIPPRWALRGARLLEALYHAVDRVPDVDSASVDMGSHHWNCDAARAKKELGFTPRDPQVTINDTVRYLKERGIFRR